MHKINYFFMGEVTQVKSVIALTDSQKESYARIAITMAGETGATPINCIHALFKAMNNDAERVAQELLHGQAAYNEVKGILSMQSKGR